MISSEKLKIVLISTGGTIEKTYSELEGILNNEYNVLDVILEQIRLDGVEIIREQLMNKDSLQITESDLKIILETVTKYALNTTEYHGIVIVHGTDRLSFTGDKLYHCFQSKGLSVPIVLTGAMRPYMMRNTDAVQNITEALLAVQLLKPGVYVAMHNRVWQFPGVVKNRKDMTFEKI